MTDRQPTTHGWWGEEGGLAVGGGGKHTERTPFFFRFFLFFFYKDGSLGSFKPVLAFAKLLMSKRETDRDRNRQTETERQRQRDRQAGRELDWKTLFYKSCCLSSFKPNH